MRAPFKVGDRVVVDVASQGFRPGPAEGREATVTRVLRSTSKRGVTWLIDAQVDAMSKQCRCRCGDQHPTPLVVQFAERCYRPVQPASLFDIEEVA